MSQFPKQVACSFNTRRSIYIKCKAFHTKISVLNKPPAEGRVNHVCTEEHRRRSSTLQQ